jgi:hypothetical protein
MTAVNQNHSLFRHVLRISSPLSSPHFVARRRRRAWIQGTQRRAPQADEYVEEPEEAQRSPLWRRHARIRRRSRRKVRNAARGTVKRTTSNQIALRRGVVCTIAISQAEYVKFESDRDVPGSLQSCPSQFVAACLLFRCDLSGCFLNSSAISLPAITEMPIVRRRSGA